MIIFLVRTEESNHQNASSHSEARWEKRAGLFAKCGKAIGRRLYRSSSDVSPQLGLYRDPSQPMDLPADAQPATISLATHDGSHALLWARIDRLALKGQHPEYALVNPRGQRDYEAALTVNRLLDGKSGEFAEHVIA
jgi:hypothetical protein